MAQLIVTSETGETSSLFINEDVVTIGRRKDNNLCLPHLSVSGAHAKISNDRGCLVLEDAGSTNGTLVNGTPVKKHVLIHSDEITIGNFEIRYSETYRHESGVANFDNVTAITPTTVIKPIIDPTIDQIISEVAALKIASGNKAGAVFPLEKNVTTLGKPGIQAGAISKKPTGYYFIPMSVDPSGPSIKHNGAGLPVSAEVKLAGGDYLEIAGEQVQFIYPYYT